MNLKALKQERERMEFAEKVRNKFITDSKDYEGLTNKVSQQNKVQWNTVKSSTM